MHLHCLRRASLAGVLLAAVVVAAAAGGAGALPGPPLAVAVVEAPPAAAGRIVGGNVTTIEAYRFAASCLYSWDGNTHFPACGGAVLNPRTVLTSGGCFGDDLLSWRWLIRVGSSFSGSGGSLYPVSLIIVHPGYSPGTRDSDIALVRAAQFFTNAELQPAAIAGPNYYLLYNETVTNIGWGNLNYTGPPSEQLRAVSTSVLATATCRAQYAALQPVTDNMVCAGLEAEGGRGPCIGDTGGPLLHHGAVVGVYSWRYQCGLPNYAAIHTRVSAFTSWIQANA